MINLNELDVCNAKRAAEWPGNEYIDLAFRGLENAGEAGELANAIKKLIRHDAGILGNKQSVMRDELVQNIADEMGDVVITVSLIAFALNLDTGRCVIDKFNKTSIKHGLKTRL